MSAAARLQPEAGQTVSRDRYFLQEGKEQQQQPIKAWKDGSSTAQEVAPRDLPVEISGSGELSLISKSISVSLKFELNLKNQIPPLPPGHLLINCTGPEPSPKMPSINSGSSHSFFLDLFFCDNSLFLQQENKLFSFALPHGLDDITWRYGLRFPPTHCLTKGHRHHETSRNPFPYCIHVMPSHSSSLRHILLFFSCLRP
jgi:hypothetical protein